MKRIFAILTLIIALVIPTKAQIVQFKDDVLKTDSIRRAFDSGPYFGLYKDNYFIFGTTIGQRPTVQNSNVKFQISISQKLTKSTLPFGTYLYLFYTQKVFWNILENSMPMTELNFNPGIGIAKPLFVKDRFIGKVMMMIEHESNGRDSIYSRSWERISFGANILIDANLSVHGKFWIPIVDGMHNQDILKYCGIYQMGVSYNTGRWGASVITVKRKSWKLNYNTIIELSYKINSRQNQYLFLQYYNGYGEGLFDYNKFRSQLRVGFVIKPNIFSDY